MQLLGKKEYDACIYKLLHQQESIKDWYNEQGLNSLKDYSKRYQHE